MNERIVRRILLGVLTLWLGVTLAVPALRAMGLEIWTTPGIYCGPFDDSQLMLHPSLDPDQAASLWLIRLGKYSAVAGLSLTMLFLALRARTWWACAAGLGLFVLVCSQVQICSTGDSIFGVWPGFVVWPGY